MPSRRGDGFSQKATPRKTKPKLLDFDGLLAYAGRALTVRAQTTSELREKLRRKAAERSDVERVLRHLRQIGYLNDHSFAESFATWRRDHQGLGKTRVLRDLLARRVAPELAKQAAEAAYSGSDEIAMIERFLERKYRGKDLGALLARENPDHARQLSSAYRKLRLAGFSSGNSIQVLKRYAAEAEMLEESEGAEA
jgi:regulatory protein